MSLHSEVLIEVGVIPDGRGGLCKILGELEVPVLVMAVAMVAVEARAGELGVALGG